MIEKYNANYNLFYINKNIRIYKSQNHDLLTQKKDSTSLVTNLYLTINVFQHILQQNLANVILRAIHCIIMIKNRLYRTILIFILTLLLDNMYLNNNNGKTTSYNIYVHT